MSTINISTLLDELTLEQKAKLVSGQDFWYTAKVDNDNIKQIMVSDGPSGLRKQADKGDALGLNGSVQAVSFPGASLMASSFNENTLFNLGKKLGLAANAEHIVVLLGPGVNIKRSPLAGRNFEYMSEDPLISGKLGAAYVNGVQSTGTGVSVKHFAANNRENQRFTCSSEIDERTLREIYLSQFEYIVKKAHPATMMCSYNKLNGVSVAENHHLLTDILRDEWGFDGVVLSDWGAVNNRFKTLLAGLDLEMPGRVPESVNEIVSAVNEGRLDEAILDRAVKHVLEMIQKWGSFDTDVVYDKAEQHQFARKAATEGMVLLKNENNTLPISDKDKIAVIGELAAKPRYQGGGSSHVNAYQVVTPLEAMPDNAQYQQGYELDTDKDNNNLMEAALELAKTSDKVIFFAGFSEETESEGFDKTTISLAANQVNLLHKIAAVNKNIVVVLQNGSVVEMPWIDDASAILETYLAGEAVGEATWDVLTGRVNPSGKLAETFPIKLSDNPTFGTFDTNPDKEVYHEGIFVGYRYYDTKKMAVQFPFGHGLSYTKFKYDNLSVGMDGNKAKIEFTIKNIGSVAGSEAAQVYISNKVSAVEKPEKELRAFTKVYLEPGERKTVSIELPYRAFAWYNVNEKMWQADIGDYEIQVGSSSRDIRLKSDLYYTAGVKKKINITMDTYVKDFINIDDPKVKNALKVSGLGPILQKMIAESNTVGILTNIPLRALVMVGLPQKMLDGFLDAL